MMIAPGNQSTKPPNVRCDRLVQNGSRRRLIARQHSSLKSRVIGTASLAVFLSPHGLAAQSCAMCYTTAGAAGRAAIQALKQGIVILMIPPVVLFTAIFVIAFRRRNQFNEDASWE
jgi:hypothetical protein